jgi:uncharacterized protein (TIGR02466 family)
VTLDIAISPEISLIFPTPISIRALTGAEGLNRGLERAVLERRRSDGGYRHSNVGGWQSTPDFFDWPEPEAQALKSEVIRAVRHINAAPAMMQQGPASTGQNLVGYRGTGWANVNENGDYNTPHVHAGEQWSIVYYVAIGEPESGRPLNGRLELRDPRPAANFGNVKGFTFGQPLEIDPKPGMMVIFPAWLEHWVHPFHGKGQRISIAMNLTIDGRASESGP